MYLPHPQFVENCQFPPQGASRSITADSKSAIQLWAALHLDAHGTCEVVTGEIREAFITGLRILG